jgi:hypothetical protein
MWASGLRLEMEVMRPWKAILGIGAACAACCAVPLLGGAAALTAGSAALVALDAAIAECSDEFLPLAGVLLVLAAAGGGLVWRRRRATRKSEPQVGCDGGCNANGN